MLDTLALPTPVAYVRKSAYAAAAATLPPLTGRYEVIIPNSNQVIFFAETLREAARQVAVARWGNEAKAKEVLAFLESVEQRGGIAPGQYGVRIHRPLDDGSPWTAKVRGAQPRALPKYAIGDFVEASELLTSGPAQLKPGRVGRVYSVVAVNDSRPGKQYAYLVGSQRVREDRLRAAAVVDGELDFDSLSA